MSAAASPSLSSGTAAASDGAEGAWVGIDLGTSNCACAVWDSTRGRPKPLQLATPGLELARPRKGKIGRVVPSVVLLGDGDDSMTGMIFSSKQKALVGMGALKRLEENNCDAGTNEIVSRASITSVKRLIGQNDEQILASLPFNTVEREDGTRLLIQPLNSSSVIEVTPVQVLALILRSIRVSANSYLRKQIPKKRLQVPGSSPVAANCVIGVPAQFGINQKLLIQKAARLAGFEGHISTITESTAASMAYGLFVSVPTSKYVLVVDIGGGTTDLTVVELKPDEEFRVVATFGDRQLGGDDMDEALKNVVMKKLNNSSDATAMTKQEVRSLLLSCRSGKELLCGTEEDSPSESCTIRFNQRKVEVSQQEFNKAIKPLLQRLQGLIHEATSCVKDSMNGIDEVVLVGGVTRVPEVRRLIQKQFPHIQELCCSLNPEGAVAQGAAIQAAIQSGLVPLSELKSALMLDALPHPIGVLDPSGELYIPILEKDSQLPAMGYATFTLASPTQLGVTVVVVEDTSDSLEELGEFTFLLRKLKNPPEKRQIDIGMTMETSGKFIVSIFDENDPEHVQKKRRYQQLRAGGQLGFDDSIETEGDDGTSKILVVACVALFLMYIVAKISFHEVNQQVMVEVDEYGIAK